MSIFILSKHTSNPSPTFHNSRIWILLERAFKRDISLCPKAIHNNVLLLPFHQFAVVSYLDSKQKQYFLSNNQHSYPHQELTYRPNGSQKTVHTRICFVSHISDWKCHQMFSLLLSRFIIYYFNVDTHHTRSRQPHNRRPSSTMHCGCVANQYGNIHLFSQKMKHSMYLASADTHYTRPPQQRNQR